MARRPAVDWDGALADPVAFCTTFLRRPDGETFQPHPAQEQILRGIRRRTVIDTGRQFGKTEVMAAIVVRAAVTHPNWEVAIVAPSLEQARIMFALVEMYFLSAPLKGLLSGKIKQYPFPVIRLKNGTTITARGANSPQFIRGNRWHFVVVDEADFIKEDVIAQAIEPTMTVTGKAPDAALILVSTP